MEQHAVPHSVTNFEFKLIGWFTIRQFMYLLLSAGIAVVMFFVIPVPGLNILLAACSVGAGAVLVFYKHNERPLDVWIKNFIFSVMHASQYLYHKNNDMPEFLKGVQLSAPEAVVQAHVDASQKLNAYMTQTGQTTQSQSDKQAMNTLIHATPAQPIPVAQGAPAAGATQPQTPSTPPIAQTVPLPQQTPQPDHTPTEPVQMAHPVPFLSGIVRNNKDEPLQNIMIYVNSDAGQVVRILKTNHNGVFATFHPLPSGTYVISPKDLGGTYFFDTMNVTVEGSLKEPISIYSKELL